MSTTRSMKTKSGTVSSRDEGPYRPAGWIRVNLRLVECQLLKLVVAKVVRVRTSVLSSPTYSVDDVQAWLDQNRESRYAKGTPARNGSTTRPAPKRSTLGNGNGHGRTK